MGVEGGQWPYFVMELLTCESLNEQIKRLGKLTTNQALPLFIKVADALAQSHSQGIVHRDIKPGNLMLVKDGSGAISNIKIVDFGIARVLGNDQASQSQTATGMIFGTPYYMSPEQCSGLKVDQRSDIYSFGCALYETLTGRPPFVGNNAFETFLLHQTAPILLSTLDPRLSVIMERLLAKEPSARYQTMADVSRDLKRVLRGPGTASSAALKPATVPVEVVTGRRGRFTKGQNIMMSLVAIAIGIITLLCQSYHQEVKKIAPLLTDSPRLTALPVPLGGSAAPPEMCELDNIKVLLYRESIAKNAFRRYGGTEQQLKKHWH
jgi:serine/threonine protein kinase